MMLVFHTHIKGNKINKDKLGDERISCGNFRVRGMIKIYFLLKIYP